MGTIIQTANKIGTIIRITDTGDKVNDVYVGAYVRPADDEIQNDMFCFCIAKNIESISEDTRGHVDLMMKADKVLDYAKMSKVERDNNVSNKYKVKLPQMYASALFHNIIGMDYFGWGLFDDRHHGERLTAIFDWLVRVCERYFETTSLS